MARAIFLDRDGVINSLIYNREQGIIDSPLTEEQYKLLPGIAEAIRELHNLDYKVIVASNQPGIAKGKMSAETFQQIRNKMERELEKREAPLDAEYYCFQISWF